MRARRKQEWCPEELAECRLSVWRKERISSTVAKHPSRPQPCNTTHSIRLPLEPILNGTIADQPSTPGLREIQSRMTRASIPMAEPSAHLKAGEDNECSTKGTIKSLRVRKRLAHPTGPRALFSSSKICRIATSRDLSRPRQVKNFL